MVLCNLAFLTKRLFVILMSLKVVHFQIDCVDVTVNLHLQVVNTPGMRQSKTPILSKNGDQNR